MNKLVYIFFLVVFFVSSCKKSKEARRLEKEINDTKWVFYYAEDADGNDITQQVLADSVICECFEFHKTDKDATTFNAEISDCSGTYFESYKANWGVFDWKKIDKERKKENLPRVDFSSDLNEIGVAVGNMGLENTRGFYYLRSIKFDTIETLLRQDMYLIESNGLQSDVLLGYRYYRKVE